MGSMKRLSALFLVPAFALALSACSGGQDSPEPSATQTPSPSATASTPDPSQAPASETDVVGQWGGATDDSPVLWFNASGTFTGNDGCNSLLGGWEQTGQQIELKNVTMTLIACVGVDDWISKTTTVQVEGDNLLLTNKAGDELGTLPRTKVAG